VTTQASAVAEIGRPPCFHRAQHPGRHGRRGAASRSGPGVVAVGGRPAGNSRLQHEHPNAVARSRCDPTLRSARDRACAVWDTQWLSSALRSGPGRGARCSMNSLPKIVTRSSGGAGRRWLHGRFHRPLWQDDYGVPVFLDQLRRATPRRAYKPRDQQERD
jgi:hypothetical protein